MGGAKGSFSDIQTWLEIALKPFKLFQHLVATTELTLGENTATARTICHNPMVIEQNGQDHVMFCGLWYRDEFRRTEAGWRITSRIEEHGYFYNIPPNLKPAPALEATP